MTSPASTAIAIVGVGAILPDAPTADAFWKMVTEGHYAIKEVDPQRWDPALYYDADHKAPEKTYSKIGGWVRDWEWDPMAWGLPIPPKVSDAMDDAQKWAVAGTRMALLDYGWPERPLDLERTAVVLGNAMSGEQHYLTTLRTMFPEVARELGQAPSFAALPADVRASITEELRGEVDAWLPPLSEDTMPGELGNCLAGRVANLFNLRGPNFVVDAACASAMAAMDASIEALVQGECDAAITGGIDRNMGASTFIKFCAIGALSGTGTRPYADGADGFVMGEGAALFVIKRLADAERDGDHIYAVVRGISGSSDGKGKGITAPNPIGQRLAMQRAWARSGVDPHACGLIEGHGTSTRVGDVVEVESLGEVFSDAGLRPASVALGSVKSNIGHLKGGAGAAGMLKAALALHHKVLPPSLGFVRPNPNIDWDRSPFAVNTELREWELSNGSPRVAGVSAFGFGGTNFHAVLEEYVPGHITHGNGHSTASVPADIPAQATAKAPPRGAAVVGADDVAGLAGKLRPILEQAQSGVAPAPEAPEESALRSPERIAIDYADAGELAERAALALKALDSDNPAAWKALAGRGIFRGSGAAGKVAFLYTGQGSQYANMLAELRKTEPIVAETFDEADRIMRPLLDGRALSDLIFVDPSDKDAMAAAEADLMRTEITQPAVLTVDTALTKLLAAYGIGPDLVMGHSLGEYGALIAAGVLTFDAALEAVSARGREMAHVDPEDKGAMAAVFAPLEEVQKVVDEVDGYVVMANVNSSTQVVLGGATEAVERAMELLAERGHQAVRLPVSHAFHTEIVAGAAEPLRETLRRLTLSPPELPVVANVDGELYPMGPGVEEQMVDILGRQVSSPVQFVKGLQTLYEQGARVFVETGPKRALWGFADDVLGDDIRALYTNHPKVGDIPSLNQALCSLWAAGLGVGRTEQPKEPVVAEPPAPITAAGPPPAVAPAPAAATPREDAYRELGRMFAGVIERGHELLGGEPSRHDGEPVVITGASVGLPGTERTFDDANVGRILNGEQLIDVIPSAIRQEMVDHHITRLVKSDGGGHFESIDSTADVIKLAARAGGFDLAEEFGVDAERVQALGRDTQLAIAAGIDALRDAGIPLVQHYKTTTRDTQLPDRWLLPKELRDDTGVIFASAFPGLEEFADELNRFWADRGREEQIEALEAVRSRMNGDQHALAEIERRIHDLQHERERNPYQFDRRFLFRVLSMGHSQLAELIGARGPNTQINSACASTTQAVAIAQDWIRAGRCSRVVIVASDDATSDKLLPWLGSGFLASGAAATDAAVEDAALPFDVRRHGMLLGMGAAGFVVESAPAARERGIAPICEVLGIATANSAFHGTRLDVHHIAQVMEDVVSQAEARGVSRGQIAPETLFVSHETYTPARGGSAAAEIHALRQVFGAGADQIVIANTKGYTGHPMGVGIEDVVAVKALETGVVPAVPNFREIDPELGQLNLSKGGAYPIRHALRLAAGFGSQISMMLLRWTPVRDGRHRSPDELGYEYRVADPAAWGGWLRRISGQDDPRLEVAQRRLRVVVGVPSAVPAPSPAPAPEPEPEPIVVAETADRGPQTADGGVLERVMELVAAETGYPTDLLDPDLDLEADLGIDTVKQAEVFAAIRDSYDIAFDENLKLRDYPTLRHVVGFVEERLPQAEPAADRGPQTADGGVLERVMELVSAETGYPTDLLDPDLDLEADLGIDTVKQAEVFAAIRDSYDIAFDENLKLRDYPTLRDVVGFVEERLPQAAPARAPAAAAPAAAPVAAADGVLDRVMELVSAETGYPTDLLDPDLDLEADLGIDTVKQAEVFAAIRDSYDIAFDENLKLRDYPTLRAVVGFVEERLPQAEPAAAPAPAAPVAAADGVLERVMELVSAETGYPTDLLDPDLDLEADLGIDTVKQAEVFAAIRDSYDIAFDENLKLRDYPTLRAVVGFVEERLPQAGTVAEPAATTPQSEVRSPQSTTGYPRRIPAAVLRPALDICVPTGVELGEGKRIVLMPDRGKVAGSLATRLEKLGLEILKVEGVPTVEELEHQIAVWQEQGSIDGVYWLPALDEEGDIDSLDPQGWRDGLHLRVKLLAAAMRMIGDAFLVSATRLGGRHGYDAEGATSVMGGAVSGFTKALAREREQQLVKVVDFGASRKPSSLAERLIEETLRDPGAVEIGYADDMRWTVALIEREAEDDPERMLGSGHSFVITGAAGSIVSAITTDLARASGGTFHLLDLVPAPDRDSADLERFASDRDGLKLELAERLKQAGERPTPKLVERDLARIERSRAALDAILAIEAAGGSAHWHQVDLTDPDKVAEAVAGIREQSERVDVLLHCAGLEISHFLPDKPQSEYDLVFDVKSNGWFNLLHALRDTEIGTAVVFSSIAGRFGNGGQTDYSAANDLLCKSASNMRRSGRARGVAIDWTAWAGIGMASRGSIPKMMEMAGIDMLPAEIGIPIVRREIVAGGSGGETLVAGALGILLEERHPSGGLDAEAASERIAGTHGPMTGRVEAMTVTGGVSIVTELDPANQPFLDHHRIDGTPVLPGVMGIEGFAEVAGALLPGWSVDRIEDVDLEAPFKFFRDEPRKLELRALLRDGGDGSIVADCKLVGRRKLAGQDEELETVHFTGTVWLAREARKAPAAEHVPDAGDAAAVSHDDVYRVYFHGPAYQVLERAYRHDSEVVGEYAAELPPNHQPTEEPMITAPRLVELCFQTAGMWELGSAGRMALPTHVDRVVSYPGAGEPGHLWAIVRPRNGTDSPVDAEVVDDQGKVRVRLEGYRTIAMPGGVDAEALEPIQSALGTGIGVS